MQKELPIGWTKTKLGDICTKPQYGWTTQSDISGDFKYLRTTDISKGKIDWDRMPYCIDVPEDKEKYLLGKDDIVVSRAGSVGLSYRITDTPQPTLFASYLIRFKPIKVFPKIVEYYLKSDMYWKAISEMSAGIAVQNVNAVKLSDLDFPLPPLSTQQRMVAKLDTLFEHLDALKNRFDRIPQLLKDFRQKVLTQAVTGKLTEGWREKRELEEWKIEIASVCCIKVQSGGTPKGGGFSDEGIPFLKVYNIVNNQIDFEYRPQFVTTEVQNKALSKSIAYPGDVLMNIVGPPLNKIAILPADYPEWNLNQAITLFRTKKYLLNTFLYYFFCEGKSVREIMGETKGVVGQVNISLSQCRDFEIPIPTIVEQQEIVRRVESLFAKADQIEASYQKLTAKIEQLPQALLAKAFRGELVEQLPTDGDARQLLEEIRKAKTGLEKGGKIKKMKGDEETRMVAEGGSRYGLRRI